MTFVVAGPIVPDRGPARPSTRAEIEVYRRRLAAARVRRYNRSAAAEIESQTRALGRHWSDSGVNSERIAAAERREAAVQREVAELQREDDFRAARAAAQMAHDRREFYQSPAAAAARAVYRAGR